MISKSFKIKWLISSEKELINTFDEDNEIIDEEIIQIQKNDIDEIDIFDENERSVSMQFGNGSVLFNVDKNEFEIIEEM